MLFNSPEFLIFAAVFFLLWPLLKRRDNSRWFYLVVASFFFYGWWDWRFLFLIIGSGLIDYVAGLVMARRPQQKRLLLVLSVLGNIGALAVFKYSGFVADNLQPIAEMLGYAGTLRDQLPQMTLITPVGISFYTFQSMSYTIDIYRGKLEPTRNILHFFAYLSLFPQLVAGPIVRAADLLPQLRKEQEVTGQESYDALKMIIRGFFKKLVVADVVAPVVNEAFGAPNLQQSSLFWWAVISLFALQIYCDFSGYSDIAIGLGKWMGYGFPTNFKHPYISTSMQEFWTRWHISLSTWFRDYVYIPLGGSRCVAWRAHLNMWITMVISGFWHGAAWPFLAWGALHAALLSAERATSWPDRLKRLPYVGRHLALILCWVLTLIGWVFFRSGTVTREGVSQMGRAMEILWQMFSFHNLNPAPAEKILEGATGTVLALVFLRHLYYHFGLDTRQRLRCPPRVWAVLEPIGYALVIVACVYFRGSGDAFIYFQF